MMALMVVLAFAAGVVAKVYAETGRVSFLLLALALSMACVLVVIVWFIRERASM